MNKSIHPLFALRHGVAQLLLWSAFYYLLPALLPLLRAEGVPTEAVSAAISGALLLWALTLPVAGSLVDKGHGVLLMRGGGLLGCLLMVLALVLPRQVALVPIVLLGFTMASTLYDPCFALLLRTRGLDASGAITKVTLIAGLATVMTYPLVSALRHVMPWPAIVLVFAVVALVGVALLPSQPSAPSGKVREVDTRALAVASLPVILLVATPFGLGIFSHASMLFVLPLALTEQGWDAAMVLLLPAMLGPAQVVGRLVWLKFAPTASVDASVLTLFSLLLVTPVALAVSGGNWMTIILAMVLQGGLHGINTVLRPLVVRSVLPVETIGRSLGFVAMIGIFCMAIAPVAAGFVHASFGFYGLVGLVACSNLAALLVTFALVGLSRRRLAWNGS